MSNKKEHASITRHFFFSSYQKILKHLATHPSGEQTEKEIQEAVSISRASANANLRALVGDGLVSVERKGKTAFYAVDFDHPVVRQTKTLITLIEINPLIEELKDVAEKIILFGSASTGTDIEESDIDLFVLANQPNKVSQIINKSGLSEKVQAVVKKATEYLPLKKKDPVFYEELSRGFLIWEKKR